MGPGRESGRGPAISGAGKRRHTGLTAWHWVAFLALFACALLPVAFHRHPGPWGGIALVGVVLVVLGLVDHLRLVRAFQPGEGR